MHQLKHEIFEFLTLTLLLWIIKEQFCQLSIIKQTRLWPSADSLDDMSWFTGTDSRSLTFSRVAHQTEGISSSRPASSGGFTCISTGNLILSNVAKVKETNGNQPHIVCCKSLTELHRQVYGMWKTDEGNLQYSISIEKLGYSSLSKWQ